MQNMEEIYIKHAEMVYKYVFCLTRNKDMAEEIVQETFEIAIRDINKFKGECKISTWLCQIAKYTWYGKIRKEKKNETIPIENLENTIILENSIEENIIKKEEKLEVYRKIQNLDAQTKDVMYLRILGNLEYSEIAQIMGKTENWARVVFFRGKQKMKEEK